MRRTPRTLGVSTRVYRCCMFLQGPTHRRAMKSPRSFSKSLALPSSRQMYPLHLLHLPQNLPCKRHAPNQGITRHQTFFRREKDFSNTAQKLSTCSQEPLTSNCFFALWMKSDELLKALTDSGHPRTHFVVQGSHKLRHQLHDIVLADSTVVSKRL